MVIHWSLSDSKSPQVSRTLRSILTVLNNTVVWMVSPLVFQLPSPQVPIITIIIIIIIPCKFFTQVLAGVL